MLLAISLIIIIATSGNKAANSAKIHIINGIKGNDDNCTSVSTLDPTKEVMINTAIKPTINLDFLFTFVIPPR